MNGRAIVYWVATGLVALVFGVSGVQAVVHAPLMMKALAHLGYPPHF
jgi:hypothetical protein